ncbi:hypothetical protein K503DRAFT_275194 [Rhizopogon vinicolor AM-OR11-026]|uniref:Uncharacterized protein n=1 Tax=Rhizopogon vinicolor AM-OR11-026 TaxID=1314800 RepID=A0A1B7NDB7_9AGAM|nr:hypothetical protein K503DRAFT_275194 [Rhizopogon vinicolor AM-OR11-026]
MGTHYTLQQGQINEVRTQHQILTSSQGTKLSMDSRTPETMCTHLKNCQRQPEDVREQAYALCLSRGWIKGSPGSRSVILNTHLQQVVDLPLQTLPNLHVHGIGMNRDMGSTSASQFGVPPLFLSSFPLASGSGMNSSSQASMSASNLQAPIPNYRPGSVPPQPNACTAHFLYLCKLCIM